MFIMLLLLYVTQNEFCLSFLDDLTDEEEARVAVAVNRFLREFVDRGSSPTPDDIIRFSESARIMMRNARRAREPEQKKGN